MHLVGIDGDEEATYGWDIKMARIVRVVLVGAVFFVQDKLNVIGGIELKYLLCAVRYR